MKFKRESFQFVIKKQCIDKVKSSQINKTALIIINLNTFEIHKHLWICNVCAHTKILKRPWPAPLPKIIILITKH